MKDSGIEWIGEIPEGWEVHRVKNHFSIISGSGFKSELQGKQSGDFPVCKASDISIAGHYLRTAANYITADIAKSQGFSVIPKGSILFAKVGEAMRKNNRTLCLIDCCADNNCQGLVPQNISSEYAYYLFTCIDMTWFDNAGTIPCINNQKLSDCRVPFPSYTEQDSIAHYLNFQCSKINQLLHNANSSIEEYKKLKQALITQAVTKGIRGEREMKDSGVEWIGEIPLTHSIYKLKYLLRTPLKYGANESGVPYSDNLPRYIRITDITPDGNLKDTGKLSLSKESAKDYILEDGDILFARSGATVGKSFIYHQSYGCSAYAGYLIKASLNDKVFPKFVYYYTCSSLYETQKNSIFIQSTIQNIGADRYANLPVSVPDTLHEQKEIADYLDAKCTEIDKLIAKKEQLVKELEAYKKSLIYEAVTGKREA